MENQKISNRAIQGIYATYKDKREVEKALSLLKTVSLHESTYKFLSFFTRREARRGVTQAKIETICKAVGISISTYAKTVRPDLDSFEEPLIIMVRTQRIGKRPIRKGTRKSSVKTNVTGTPYKILQPLSKIEKWVPKKQEEILQQHKDFIKQITEEKE